MLLLGYLLLQSDHVRDGRIESVRRLLRHWPSPGHSLNFFNLQFLSRFFASLFTEPFVFFVHIQNQFLHVVARNLVLVVIPWTDAQMQWFVTFFLLGSLFKARAFSSQSQLHHLLLRIVAGALATNLYYPFHVATFSPDKSPGHLELTIIIYLDVESTCILNVILLVLRAPLHGTMLLTRLEYRPLVSRLLLARVENVLIGELCHLLLLLLLGLGVLCSGPCGLSVHLRLRRLWHRATHGSNRGRHSHWRDVCLRCRLESVVRGRGLRLVKHLRLVLLLLVFLVKCIFIFGSGGGWCFQHPFNRKSGVVLIEVEVVQRLLSEKRRHDICEFNGGVTGSGFDSDFADLSEDFEDLYLLIRFDGSLRSQCLASWVKTFSVALPSTAN